jgi:hypothetical protein
VVRIAWQARERSSRECRYGNRYRPGKRADDDGAKVALRLFAGTSKAPRLTSVPNPRSSKQWQWVATKSEDADAFAERFGGERLPMPPSDDLVAPWPILV